MAEEKENGPVTPEVEVEDLPKTIVRRLVKEKLSQLSRDGDMSLLRDAQLAFSESARVFIHYLSAAANDICMESKRQTMSAEDVFKALEDIEFSEFIDPLRVSLEEFRQKNSKRKAKSSKSAESSKMAKKEDNTAENGEIEKQKDPTDDPKGKDKKTGAKNAQTVEIEEDNDGQEGNRSDPEDEEGNESDPEEGHEDGGSGPEEEHEGNASEDSADN